MSRVASTEGIASWRAPPTSPPRPTTPHVPHLLQQVVPLVLLLAQPRRHLAPLLLECIRARTRLPQVRRKRNMLRLGLRANGRHCAVAKTGATGAVLREGRAGEGRGGQGRAGNRRATTARIVVGTHAGCRMHGRKEPTSRTSCFSAPNDSLSVRNSPCICPADRTYPTHRPCCVTLQRHVALCCNMLLCVAARRAALQPRSTGHIHHIGPGSGKNGLACCTREKFSTAVWYDTCGAG